MNSSKAMNKYPCIYNTIEADLMENKTIDNNRYALLNKAVDLNLYDLYESTRLKIDIDNAMALGLRMLAKSTRNDADEIEVFIRAVSDEFGLTEGKLVSQVSEIFDIVIGPIMLEIDRLSLWRMKRTDFDMDAIKSEYIKPCASRIYSIVDTAGLSMNPCVKTGIVYPILMMPIVIGMHDDSKFYSAFAKELARLEEDGNAKALILAFVFGGKY